MTFAGILLVFVIVYKRGDSGCSFVRTDHSARFRIIRKANPVIILDTTKPLILGNIQHGDGCTSGLGYDNRLLAGLLQHLAEMLLRMRGSNVWHSVTLFSFEIKCVIVRFVQYRYYV